MKKREKKETLHKFTTSYHFLPDATRGAVRGLTRSQLADTGTHDLVVNTLHLLISPGHQKIAQLGGMHKFMNWNGYLLSDSGGFQVFSLIHLGKWVGEVDDNGAKFKSPKDGTVHILTPEISIDIQMALGTDIMVVLDDCRKGVTTREEAEVSVENTIKWAKRCKEHFMNNYSDEEREGKLLTAVVQGANFSDLREKCAKELMEIGFDGYNFGGYLLDNQGKLVKEQLKLVAEITPNDKIKYAMGVGKPEDIIECAKLGYKLFDTVLPTRNARHGTLYTSDPKLKVLKIGNANFSEDNTAVDPSCDCELCKYQSRAYLHHLLKNHEMTGMTLATIHNLTYYSKLMRYLNCERFSIEKPNEEIFEDLSTFK